MGEWFSQRSAKPRMPVRFWPGTQNKNGLIWKAGHDELKEYLWNEFRYNVLKKYYGYFDEWYENITDTQRMYYISYMKGKKTPFEGE